MGVDAEIEVRLKHKITPEALLIISCKMVDCFGHEGFYFKDEPYQYCWDEKRQEEIKVPMLLAKNQSSPHALTLDETRKEIVLHTLCRYYGDGYERGPIHDFLEWFDFLDYHLRKYDPTILYGGDSGGAEGMVPITSVWITKMKNYFYKEGHTPYRGAMSFSSPSAFSPSRGFPGAPQICPRCGTIPNQSGTGPAYASYYCNSCDNRWKTRDAGVMWLTKADEWKIRRESQEALMKTLTEDQKKLYYMSVEDIF